MFDRAYNVTYWVNYSELKLRLRRRYLTVEPQLTRFHENVEDSVLALRLMSDSSAKLKVKALLLGEEAPQFTYKNLDMWLLVKNNQVSDFLASLWVKPYYAINCIVTSISNYVGGVFINLYVFFNNVGFPFGLDAVLVFKQELELIFEFLIDWVVLYEIKGATYVIRELSIYVKENDSSYFIMDVILFFFKTLPSWRFQDVDVWLLGGG